MVVNTATNKKDGCTAAIKTGKEQQGHVSRKTSAKRNVCLKTSIFFNFVLLTLLCGTAYYLRHSRQQYCKKEIENGKIEMELQGLEYEVKGCNVYPVETEQLKTGSLQGDNAQMVSSSHRPIKKDSPMPSVEPGPSKTGEPRPSDPVPSKTKIPRPTKQGVPKSPRPSNPGFSKTKIPRPTKRMSPESPRPSPKPYRELVGIRDLMKIWEELNKKDYKYAMPMPSFKRED